jgi:hypothetical protein
MSLELGRRLGDERRAPSVVKARSFYEKLQQVIGRIFLIPYFYDFFKMKIGFEN